MTSLALLSPLKSCSTICGQALTLLVHSPFADEHLARAKTGSWGSRVAHFCMGGLEKIPLLCAPVTVVEGLARVAIDSCARKRRARDLRFTVIKKFWEEHVQSVKISHGTSAIYHAHFKKHGISATYPAELETMIQKIRKVWTDHENDICKKTGWFSAFEERYDRAHKKGEIAFSFSADPAITHEFTRGQRGCGGEWIRELRTFLREVRDKQELLSIQEKEVVVEMEALIDVMAIVPPMVVKVGVACPQRYLIAGWNSTFLPLLSFVRYVESRAESLLIGDILHFLQNDFLPRLERDIRHLQKGYETPVSWQIPPSELECEILKSDYKIPQEKLTNLHKRWLETLHCQSLV